MDYEGAIDNAADVTRMIGDGRAAAPDGNRAQVSAARRLHVSSRNQHATTKTGTSLDPRRREVHRFPRQATAAVTTFLPAAGGDAIEVLPPGLMHAGWQAVRHEPNLADAEVLDLPSLGVRDVFRAPRNSRCVAKELREG